MESKRVHITSVSCEMTMHAHLCVNMGKVVTSNREQTKWQQSGLCSCESPPTHTICILRAFFKKKKKEQIEREIRGFSEHVCLSLPRFNLVSNFFTVFLD